MLGRVFIKYAVGASAQMPALGQTLPIHSAPMPNSIDPTATWDNSGSVVLSNAFIFRPDKVFTVDSFEAANDEMTSSHLLIMLNKRVVHGSAA